MTTNVNFDTAAVLGIVDQIKASLEAELTAEDRAALQKRIRDDQPAAVVYSAEEREQAMSDFEIDGAVEALETMADEIRAFIELRMEAAYRKALEVYYAAVELSRDPEHAELLPHVEAMRRAHEQQYGRPIPPKAENAPQVFQAVTK